MADDPYRVLGIDRDADIAEIRRAYLAQLREHHPDLRPGDPAAEERTRELNRAWDQIRRRGSRPAAARPARRPPTSSSAYSHEQRAFRTAFTTATLRIAVAVVALGLVLIALGR